MGGGTHFVGGERRLLQPLADKLGLSQPTTEEGGKETQILFATGDEFAHGKIVDFETPTSRSPRVLVVNRHQPLAPTFWQGRGRLINAVCIVSERFVEEGAFANGAIDEDRIVRTIPRKNIGLDRNEQLGRRLGKGGENRLTAKDDNVVSVGVTGGRADDMLKLRPIHARKTLE